MKKWNYFKIGASSYILLGVSYLIYVFTEQKHPKNVIQVFSKMNETIFYFMGEHTLMQFYTGFSVMMGFMLVAFGFQALMIKQPNGHVIIVNAFLSLVASIIAVIYFHPLAYWLLLWATLCFTLCLITSWNKK